MTSAAVLKQDTDRVREASDIMAVIGEYVGLKRSGSGRYIGLCPFHKERTPSFTVNVAGQRFKCFGCGAGGDVFEFVQRIEGIDFRRAKELLASRAGVPTGNRRMTPTERRNYARAAAGADGLAQCLADFARGLELAVSHTLELSPSLFEVGLDPAVALAEFHRSAHTLRMAKPRDVAHAWRAMRRDNPAAAARMETIGREDRQHAEAVTRALVDLLARTHERRVA